MEIIVRKSGYSSSKSSPRFYPHFNRATDTYYHSERDYRSDLKRRNLVPYDPDMKEGPKRTAYKPSAWSRQMVQAIKSATKHGKFKPGDRLLNEFNSRKMMPTRADLAKLPSHYQPVSKEGGFF